MCTGNRGWMCVGVSQQHFHKSTILTANRKRNREIQSSSVLIRRQLDKCGTQQIAIISIASRVPYRWIPLIYTAATLALYTPFVTNIQTVQLRPLWQSCDCRRGTIPVTAIIVFDLGCMASQQQNNPRNMTGGCF